jgi:DNA polymerase III epsilon subunit-like protein
MLMLEPLSPDAERPLTYDFALIRSEVTTDQRSAALRALTYVIFDTETTGLDPERDEIVQIGAVRVVNGRIVEGERYDTLVNPGRPIPPGSTRVHGISDDMVATAPTVADAVAGFHAFAKGAVLVAHNAPFDLAFLRRAGRRAACRSTTRCSTPCSCRRSFSADRPPIRSTRWPTGSASTSRGTCATPPSATPWRRHRSSSAASECWRAGVSAPSARA